MNKRNSPISQIFAATTRYEGESSWKCFASVGIVNFNIIPSRYNLGTGHCMTYTNMKRHEIVNGPTQHLNFRMSLTKELFPQILKLERICCSCS